VEYTRDPFSIVFHIKSNAGFKITKSFLSFELLFESLKHKFGGIARASERKLSASVGTNANLSDGERRSSGFGLLSSSLNVHVGDRAFNDGIFDIPKRKVANVGSEDFMQELRIGLQEWLNLIVSVPEICRSDELEQFLAHSDVYSDEIRQEFENERKNDDLMLISEPELVKTGVGLEDFIPIRVIGKGSFGRVLLVKKKDNDQIFAMKVLMKASILKRNQVEHTKTERTVLEHIRHPFIVTLRYAFQNKANLYLVLDYCAGGELFFHLGKDGKFDEKRAKFYSAQIVLALEYLHDLGIVYRDLKPENVLLDANGNIALTDFGLSKEGINDNSSAHSFCGTPEYLAPEILRRSGHGRAADWWSLGALLYEMLVGMPPFYSRDRERLFTKILKANLRYPQHLSEDAKSLLCVNIFAFLLCSNSSILFSHC
jgi:tRNA A-37 threonylcarbamoyl transferase component Bud32